MASRPGSFGARPCRALRDRILIEGWSCLPPSWRRKWMVQRIIATPPWANFHEIRKVYIEARRRTLMTGELWTVGHIVPLNNPRVCGLHVHWNLEPQTAAMNYARGNAWCDNHGELFDTPADTFTRQLSLI